MFKGPFYHKTIRKIVAAFGTIFNNISVVKTDTNGVEVQRLMVPLSYAQKEKFIISLSYDTTKQKPIQIELPRMSFEWTGLGYDANRKLPSVNKILTKSANTAQVLTNYTPVPYDFSFDLNIYTRDIDTMCQIIEQILPSFTPDYTVTVALISESGQTISRDVPIIHNATVPAIEYEGDGFTPRMVTCNMNFTIKAYLFGTTESAAIIRKAITNIYDTVGDKTQINVVVVPGGAGQFRYEEEVYVGNNYQNADWRARASGWSNSSNHLTIYQVTGNKLPNVGDTINGLDSGARWNIASASRTFLKHSKTVIEPLPNTANVGDANISYTYTTTEFPKIIGG